MELFETKEGQRIKALERMLLIVAEELCQMIENENDRLEKQISCTDLQPPDYLDCQTVYEAMELLKESPF